MSIRYILLVINILLIVHVLAGALHGVAIRVNPAAVDGRVAAQVERMLRKDPSALVCDRLLRKEIVSHSFDDGSSSERESIDTAASSAGESTLFGYDAFDPADFRAAVRDARAVELLLTHVRQHFDLPAYTRAQRQRVLQMLDLVDSPSDYELLKEYYEKRWPEFIGYLQECSCRLSRVDPENYQIRPFVEDTIIKQVIKRFDHQQQLVITDLGSGCLLEQFVVLNQLVDAGYTTIRLNLIDTAYARLLERYREQITPDDQGRYTIEPDRFYLNEKDYSILRRLMVTMEPMIRVQDASGATLDRAFDAVASTPDMVSLINYNRMFVSFLQWFMHRGVTFELVLYPDADAYQNDVVHELAPKTHVIMAIDYMLPQFPDLLRIFNQLRSAVLTPGGYALSVFSVRLAQGAWKTVRAHGDAASVRYDELANGAFVTVQDISEPVRSVVHSVVG